MLGFLSFSVVATVSSDLVTIEKPGFVMLGFLSSPVLANLIALLALFLAVLGLYKQRNDVVVQFLPNLEILHPNNLCINGVENALKVQVIFRSQICILNASLHDLFFFDLRAFNPQTNEDYALIHQKLFTPNPDGYYVQKKQGEMIINQDIPIARYGLLKARSFTCLDILMYRHQHVDDFGDTIIVSFKVPIRTWFKKDRFSANVKMNRHRPYYGEYPITDWQSEVQVDARG